MNDSKITIIGGGNLGSAIALGLLETKALSAGQITVTRRKADGLEDLMKLGMKATHDNTEAIRNAQVIILALKPYKIGSVLAEIKPSLKSDQLILSVASGVSLKELQEILGCEQPLFRIMPNTAIAIRESMTCISTENGTKEQQKLVLEIFEKLGEVLLIDEDLMNAATVLGACGIAYALRFIRAASQGGIELGFSAEKAHLIASQIAKGASKLLIENNRHPEEEIDKVTTPKGCTIAGLNEMEYEGFSASLIKGIRTSFEAIK
ncbi:MAG: pyrroline-5-carboxylate reductase [Cytophagales bacterium]|nr:pyrroline-5-carboxylate reductase [Cytophagales bacterium]